MKAIALIIAFILTTALRAQVISTDTISSRDTVKNYVHTLHTDSLSSSCIIIPKEVKPHYHASHAEQVVVLSGEADMMLGDQKLHIKAGDVIIIPKGVVHSVIVTSKDPLKIVSVQAPYFDGTDRIMLGK
jgi:mannose-6-phosphate isomerase-like protein (cupin superfamily)